MSRKPPMGPFDLCDELRRIHAEAAAEAVEAMACRMLPDVLAASDAAGALTKPGGCLTDAELRTMHRAATRLVLLYHSPVSIGRAAAASPYRAEPLPHAIAFGESVSAKQYRGLLAYWFSRAVEARQGRLAAPAVSAVAAALAADRCHGGREPKHADLKALRDAEWRLRDFAEAVACQFRCEWGEA